MADLRRYSGFLDTLESLFRDAMTSPNLDVIGLTIKDPSAVEQVRALLSRLTGDKFKLFTVPAGNGTLGGLITVEKTVSEKVSKALSSEHIPEMSLPESFELLSLTGKIEYLEKRTSEVLAGIEVIDRSIEKICQRWRPIYASVLDWIGERLSLLSASASAFQTKMCFFINGWIPAADIGGLKQQLTDSFGSQVVVEEKEMREEDLERVPVMLKNPAYFKPFELFTRVLPLPAYTSLDPTPFLGIFFPIFFGMILGDAGYGLFLLILSIVLKKRFLKKKMLRDATQILFISSLYTIFFGVLYSEFFGDLPLRFFGIEPVCVERRTAVIPMLYFTLAVGVAHVLLGLFLGIITALKKKTNKEAFLKLLSILIIVCLIIVLASFFDVFPEIVAQPVIMMILFLMPFLLFTG
ncbi:MAG: H(+)-transporting two-sector ATPase, partial [Nitrospirae bacterium]|nr:H(+)-transporting two-sector ATPase [Nitrospirota bacterium]